MAAPAQPQQKKTLLMTEGSIWKSILLFSVPLILGNLLQQLYNTADSIIVGNFLGSNALAAVGSSGSPIYLLIGFSQGVAVGAGVVVSQYLGAKDKKETRIAVHTSLAIAVILGLILTVGGIAVSRSLLVWMNTPEEVLGDAVTYMKLYFGGVLFSVVYNMAAGILNAAGNSRRSVIYLACASITNIILDLVLIAGLRMGVEGAAIATFISQAVGGVLPVFYFLNKRSTSSIHLGRAQWNGGVIRSACINGSSELMTNLSMSLVNILYNYQLLRFAGENGVAAYGVIMYAAFLFVAVFVGYAVGSAPIVSYHYGARNHAELNNLYSKSLRLIGVIAVVMTALSMLVIPYVARIFVGYDAELLALTSHAFRVYALNFFLMGFNVYGSSFFTALGDGVTSALISFLRTLLFQLLALILLPLVLGIEGVWLAVTAAEAGSTSSQFLMPAAAYSSLVMSWK